MTSRNTSRCGQPTFFADGRSERPLIEGTVARGHLDDDAGYYTGKGPDGKFVAEFPFPVTKDVIERGQERFNIYCTPCHDRWARATAGSCGAVSAIRLPITSTGCARRRQDTSTTSSPTDSAPCPIMRLRFSLATAGRSWRISARSNSARTLPSTMFRPSAKARLSQEGAQ